MKIQRFFLIKSLTVFSVLIVFSKIYQQNCVIKLQYAQQRLDRQYQALIKKRNLLLVTLSQAKDYSVLKKQAEQELGMTQLPLSHLITFTGRKA
jgi:hypothetical protein